MDSPAAPAVRSSRADLASLPFRIKEWFGSSRQALPARVARELDLEQHRAEILIGWVQATLVAVFTILYTASRKTAPIDAAFQPVPWALGVYAAFTALRLVLAHRGQLTRFYRALSVVFDVALLMVTIWSFHVQYGQPAAFYLKAPTLLYIFIFIALRTLSFSPAYVLFAGVVSALGWLMLLFYAISGVEGMKLVTKDYVTYMTSASVLIGGEVDKMISILLVSLLLAVAVARSRALLRRAVAEQAASAQLSRFLAPEIAEALVSADELLHPGEGEERHASVMFIDMRGYTRLTVRLPPRELIATLGEYQRITVPIVHSHHGVITTFLGDGVMVTFGALRTSQTFAADAMRCAEALIDAFESWGHERLSRNQPAVTISVGIDSGIVTCGAIGDEQRMEYAVLGNATNRAAKIENYTRKAEVLALTTLETRSLAIEQGYDPLRAEESRLACPVDGIPEPVDLVVIR
jgi:adenylate cyclase